MLSSVTTRYFHTDNLGSIAVTDETGNVVERDSYNAWGKRRFPAGADDPRAASPARRRGASPVRRNLPTSASCTSTGESTTW
jgi:hypothetical protein